MARDMDALLAEEIAAPAAHEDAIDAAYLAKDRPTFRYAGRGHVEAGLGEIEGAEVSAARGEEAQTDALRAGRDQRASGSEVREPAGAGSASGD